MSGSIRKRRKAPRKIVVANSRRCAFGIVIRMLLAESGTNQEPQVIQDAGDGFRVANFVAANHLFDFAVREGFHGNFFVFFGLGYSESQIFGEKNVHALFEKTGRWKNIEENVETLGAVTGLFNQLARGGAARIF